VKDPKAQQAKFTRAIADGKEWVLALTGTPVINKPSDLASQLAIIGRIGEFGGYWKFLQKYGENPTVLEMKELNYRLKSTCFYRRDKSEATDLPPKTRQVVMCDITTRNEYEEALRDLVAYLKQYRQATDDQVAKSMRGEVMVRIGILKNIAARGKLDACFEFVKDTLDNGEKLILFGHLREVLGKLKDKFPHVSITGEDSTIDRQKAIDQFQNNPGVNLIICSIAAAGVGITLTASSTVAFIEMGWHPAIMEQAEDRAHRIGQKDHVNCIYFIGKGTIDEWVYKLINDKRSMSSTITGAKDDVEENILNELIDLFNQKYNIS
jgi:SWI/SNF-related matrix-associated actin-dependent regulator 1 of chromatin subfamily A